MDKPSFGPPRGGRPKLDDTDRRSAPISVRFSADELAAVQGQAAMAGLSVSAFVRAAALGQRIAVRREAVPMAAVGQLRRLGNNLNQILREARVNHFPASTAVLADACLAEINAFLRKVFAHDA